MTLWKLKHEKDLTLLDMKNSKSNEWLSTIRLLTRLAKTKLDLFQRFKANVVEAEAEVSSLSSSGVEMSSGLQVGSYGLELGDGDGVF